MSLWRMFQDLDMNDNRITSLGPPKASADAATKRWVNQQLKDGVKDIEALESENNQMKSDVARMKREYDKTFKDLVKNVNNLDKQIIKLQDEIDGLRVFVKLKHSKGEEMQGDQPRVRDVIEAGKKAIEALERKVDSLHPNPPIRT